jgi:aspartyl-tRNA(Asn)/glutamyl-tRNA(Gln) amidotransferase subunit A
MVGLPSISIPVGFSSKGLPVGMQIAGRPFDEALVLRVAEVYERHIYRQTPWPAVN